MSKTRVFHFLGSGGGGVLSVVSNLLKYSVNPAIENHVIYTVNKSVAPHFKPYQLTGAVTEQVFFYSTNWNFYYTCKQLLKLLPGPDVVIVAHDWIELGMVSNLGLQNPVIQVLHGDFEYYYGLSLNHKDGIDAFLSISPTISENLKNVIPQYADKIYNFRFSVPAVAAMKKNNKQLRLIYYVRDLSECRKQFKVIVEISRLLSYCKDDFFFTIAGGGLTNEEFFKQWPAAMVANVNFAGFKTNEEMLTILQKQDIFLLPSLAEGFPVSLVEAMKAGLVPLVTNWAGAVDELVTPGVTGYYFLAGASKDYADCIRMLHKDRRLLQILSGNSIERANRLFDPVENTRRIEELFIAITAKNRNHKKKIKIYGSRLDRKRMPNIVTSIYRRLLK